MQHAVSSDETTNIVTAAAT